MTGYIEIANWTKHQHYKDRNPPWIKLYINLLSCYDYVCLQDDSKLLLYTLYLLASRYENKIPHDLQFIRSQGSIQGQIRLQPLIDKGFIICYQDDSTMIAGCKQSAIPETETETETEQSRVEKSRVEKNRVEKDSILQIPVNTGIMPEAGVAPKKISLNLDTWNWDNITEQDRSLWAKAYPAVNIDIELARAADWIKQNPTKKKSQWGRFLSAWLSRSQDRGGNGSSNGKLSWTDFEAEKKEKQRQMISKTINDVIKRGVG
jgi:hypothetical protein